MSLIKNLKIARDPEAYWRRQGWGPKLTFLIERPGAERLALTLRIPLDWQAFDALDMPADAEPPPGSMAQAVAALARVAGAAGVITVLGITRTVAREGNPDAQLFATVSVALADVPGEAPESSPAAEVGAVEFEHPDGDYRGTRIREVRRAEIVPGNEPASFLSVQYLLETEYGWLAVTFATPQVEVFEKLGLLFDKIAGGCRIEPGS
ncbi:MAG TPA: hypothetical protein VG186_10830 [Solirubrobacteraceae bacterium]|jgi:hypothetical protein|nr:hypothetical protein [Solirubrobacteraceae bacterium]